LENVVFELALSCLVLYTRVISNNERETK
jgi:hypothetical protein